MGMRLDGPDLEHKGSAEIASDATVAGAVQVPGSRQPILLLNDCQTTGGYPKIAVVISADLSSAGRLLPGAAVRFRKVTMADADEARAEAEHGFRTLTAGLVPVREA
jgi:allophanate hydrolase subunit 2